MMFDGITNKDFTPAEWKALQQFSEKAKKISEEKGIFDTEQWNPVTISESANFNIFAYSKEGLVMQAIWIIFFTAMKKKNIPLKFPTVSSFLEAYEGRFDDREEEDQKLLFDTANWMKEAFKYLPARKNKGLAVQIIPKLVEGWNAKYVTGSGQTRATADRVFIFETEGGVTPAHRGGRMSYLKKQTIMDKPRRPSEKYSATTSEVKFIVPKKKKGKRKGKKSPGASSAQKVVQPVTQLAEMAQSADSTQPYSWKSDKYPEKYTYATVGNSDLSSIELNDYFGMLGDSMSLPSSPRLGYDPSTVFSNHTPRQISQDSIQGCVQPSQALGPNNFQPLFDFSVFSSPTLLVSSPITSGDNTQRFQEVLRHPLKRAFSWESDYNEGQENNNGSDQNDTKIGNESKNADGSNKDMTDENTQKSKVQNVDGKVHKPPSFLFDEYLQSHP